MVSENADMALDDFIAKNKISGRFGKGGSRGGGRGGDRRGGRGGRGNDRGGDRLNRSGDRGAVSKRGGGGGGGFSSRRTRNMPDRWEHDMYSGGRSGGAGGGGTKLIVNNLDFGVTDADMEELFGEFGTLKKASILYDRSGRSTGSAEVEFLRGSDARQAKEQYHQVPLDGRAMTITIVGSGDNNGRDGGGRRDGGFRDRSPRGGGNRRNNSDRNRDSGDRPRRGGGGGGRGRGGGGRGKKEDITQEQLDAEMDDYLNKRE